MKNKLIGIFSILFANTTLLVASCGRNTVKQSADYLDYRTYDQKKDANYIDQNFKNIEFQKNDKRQVILFGLDGVPFENAKKNILDNSKIYTSFEFPINTWNSTAGWKSILKGDLINNNAKSIFEIIKSNKSDLTSTMTSAWVGLARDILKAQESKPTSWCDYIEKDCDPVNGWGGFSNVHSYDTVDEILRRQKIVFEKEKELINDKKINGSLHFHYDVFADEAGHSGYSYDSEMLKEIYKEYKKELNYYLDETFFPKDKYLVIAVTDHSRNNDGFNHDFEDLNNRYSWIAGNNDLNKILGRNVVNFFDIKTIIFNWLKK